MVLAAIRPAPRARAQEPGAGEPGAQERVAEEPVAEEPVAEEPVAEEPVAEEPVEKTETEPPAEPATKPEASLPTGPAEEPGEPSPEPEPTSEVRLEQLTVQAAEPAASAAPAVEKTAGEKPTGPETKEGKKPDRWPRFEFGARLMTGWEFATERPSDEQPRDDRTYHGFFLDQARIGFRARLHKRILANVSAELADAVRQTDPSDSPYLRNAFLNLRFYRKVLQLRVGRFKRPFSRLENRGTGVLPFRGRGLTNGLVVENARWGDRELGMMLWGKVRPANLAWYASLSNPDWQADPDSESRGVDLLARLVYSPVKWLSVGANGGHKVIKRPSGAVESFEALGGDLRIKTGAIYLAAEALAGQLPDEEGRPFAFGITGYGSYDVELPEDYTLQPTVFLEYADANAELLTTEAIRAIAGLNLLWRDRIRLMPQVKLVRPLGRVSELNPWFAGESFYLLLKVAI